MKDPVKLQRKRNLHDRDMDCRDYLVYVIETQPTFDEAADALEVTRQTLIAWRKIYGMEVKEMAK